MPGIFPLREIINGEPAASHTWTFIKFYLGQNKFDGNEIYQGGILFNCSCLPNSNSTRKPDFIVKYFDKNSG